MCVLWERDADGGGEARTQLVTQTRNLFHLLKPLSPLFPEPTQVVAENLEANYQYWKSKEAKPAEEKDALAKDKEGKGGVGAGAGGAPGAAGASSPADGAVKR